MSELETIRKQRDDLLAAAKVIVYRDDHGHFVGYSDDLAKLKAAIAAAEGEQG